MTQNYNITEVAQPGFKFMDGLPPYLKTPNMLLLLGCGLALIILSFFDSGRNRKRRLATSHFGSGAEKAKARRIASRQIKVGEHNNVALYIGRPNLLKNLGIAPIYLPDAQRGMAVCGGPGSGKTFSVIDPAIRSAINQGFPILLYDFKYPSQTSRIAGYALENDYEVHVFAPGFLESEVCNPLDFLKNETDSLMARQMAEVLNRNFSSGGSAKVEDPFFTQAGDQLTEAIFLLAKGIRGYEDLMMCQALLSIDNLPERIRSKSATLNPWVYASFGQLLSVASAEQTVASIVATASTNFSRFMKKQVLRAFCGHTTVPLDLKGKQMLVLGLDRERRDVVAPLLATVLHMIVNRNVAKRRTEPLILSLDELPTLYLPALVQWLNENREDGLVTLLGFQNLAQLEKTYGRELSRAILGGCASKAIFNPQEYESARMFSDFLGEEEIRYKQKSRGSSGGKRNINHSEQERTRKLFEPSQFLKLPTGHCILINPGYKSRKESSIPIQQNVQLPGIELQAIKNSQQLWRQFRQRLIRSRRSNEPLTSEDLKQRYQVADEFFQTEENTPKLVQRKQPKPEKPSKHNDEEELTLDQLTELFNSTSEFPWTMDSNHDDD
jgi:type IV secretory pathway TraG/TraD family ATPase VirD4